MLTTAVFRIIGIVIALTVVADIYANKPDSIPATVIAWAQQTGARKKKQHGVTSSLRHPMTVQDSHLLRLF